MEFEFAHKNLVVSVPQYAYFTISRPSKSDLEERETYLGKREVFHDSLFHPMYTEQKIGKDDVTRASESTSGSVKILEPPITEIDLRLTKITS
jgi:hypothetical protein